MAPGQESTFHMTGTTLFVFSDGEAETGGLRRQEMEAGKHLET